MYDTRIRLIVVGSMLSTCFCVCLCMICLSAWAKTGPSYANGGANNKKLLLIGNGMVHSNSASNNHPSSSSSSEFYSQTPFASINHFGIPFLSFLLFHFYSTSISVCLHQTTIFEEKHSQIVVVLVGVRQSKIQRATKL